MDGAASIGELIYLDHNLRWAGLFQFYGALYAIVFAPLAYIAARRFRKWWSWLAFIAIPAAIVSETAVGYFLFLDKCETQTAIEQIRPVPDSLSVAYREERKEGKLISEVVRHAVLERDGTPVATVRHFVFRSGVLARTIAGESDPLSGVSHLGIVCLRNYPPKFMDKNLAPNG